MVNDMETRTEKEPPLEQRLKDARTIAFDVQRLAQEGNLYGALYLIEQLKENERNPALYGIVLDAIAVTALKLHNPDTPESWLAVYSGSEMERLYDGLKAYCAQKAPYLAKSKRPD